MRVTAFEESAVLALAAPNAMKICNCLGDSNRAFLPSEMLRSYTEARKVFQGLGVDDKFSYQIFNRPHGYWPEIREAMLGWFDLHLRGIGHGAPKSEPDFECLPEADLMVFPEGQRPPEEMSIAEYCRKKGAAFNKATSNLPAVDQNNKVAELADILRIHEPLQLKQVHEYSAQGDWRRLALETTCGRMIPLVIRNAEAGGSFHILGDTLDKTNLEQSTIYTEALKAGDGVVLIDLWGSGETAQVDGRIGDAKIGVLYHNLSRYCLWLGRTLIGEWVRDYQLIYLWLQQEMEPQKIVLGGEKEAGLAALFASVLAKGKLPVVLENSPVSFVFNQQKARNDKESAYYSMGLHLPGIIPWGDMDMARKLVTEEVRFICPRLSDGEEVK